MKYDKIIEISEKERWCVDYEKQIVLRQEYRPDYQYLHSKSYWHNDLIIEIENLKKIVDNL
jgi:hypothetical protein